MIRLTLTIVALLVAFVPTGETQEVSNGVWAEARLERLPLPTSGYQAYLVGEFHGFAENEEMQLQYLTALNRTIGLRDVALEEDAVYGAAAQAYVESRAELLPSAVCWRASLLRGIRRMNTTLSKDQRIRVHLVDIDSPATAIRQHLEAMVTQIPGGANVAVPEMAAIREMGLETMSRLRKLTSDVSVQAELRTIEHSIRCYQEGLEVDTGSAKGSPYLEAREQAITANIADLLRKPATSPLLVLYGFDHVSKTKRNDGGPQRNQPFSPMALRLEQAGFKVFSLLTVPLNGRYFWRGKRGEMPWTAKDGTVASGESFADLLLKVREARFLYFRYGGERVRLPSRDMSNLQVDGYLFFSDATPMRDDCSSQ